MSFQLTDREGALLTELARKAVREYLNSKRHVPVPQDIPKKLLERCGVFVTINILEDGKKKLRGCIGYPYPTTPLAEAVIDSAISAATRDPRFQPLSQKELNRVVFEVSVLTPPEIIQVHSCPEYTHEIKVGEHGLIIERGMFKGLLLPQVPVEWGWNEEDFLCQCCVKAGLPPDSWLMKSTKVYRFQAIVFEEKKPEGEVKRKTIERK